MPPPRRRSRERRSRSYSPHRRRPQRRSRSRSPKRRPSSRRSRSHTPRKHSPRRSRTHSPQRRPVRRSRSRQQSFSPQRKSRSPKGQKYRRSPSPRGQPLSRSPWQSSKGQRQERRRPEGSLSPGNRKRTSISPRDSSRNRKHSRSPHRKSPPNIRHKTDYIQNVTWVASVRRQLLSDRFTTEEQEDQGDIVIEDNIVIAIQRGPHAVEVSPRLINREYNSNFVIVQRQKHEGKRRIFDREEIRKFGFDSIMEENVFEERRIISVVPSSSRRQDRRKSPEVIRKIKKGPEIKLDFRPDPRYEPLLHEDRVSRVEKNPNDLRHSLSKRKHDEDSFDARKQIEAKRKSTDGSRRDSKVFERIGDRSRERRREGSRERKSGTTSWDRDRRRSDSDRKDESEQLPDFKNRPDKFHYDEWKEKPEMIPRNPSYFEHDNREGAAGFRGRFRGRGRGFRGRPFTRGTSRGGFRGSRRPYFRGGYDSRDRGRERESAWKHDLYDELKQEEEQEKPSSTTHTNE